MSQFVDKSEGYFFPGRAGSETAEPMKGSAVFAGAWFAYATLGRPLIGT